MEIIKLNLIPSGVNPTCHAKQYDKGRIIRFELFNGLTPYTLQSGDTVTLNLRKPDNTIIEASVTATQGNKYVDLVTTEQMCAVAGYNLGTFKIVNGETDIGTLNFIMEVGKDVLANGIPSQSVIEDLDELVAEAVGDDYYTKQEVNSLLNLKANQATTYTKQEVNNALSDKASANWSIKEKFDDIYTHWRSASNDTLTYDENAESAVIPMVSGAKYHIIASGNYNRFILCTLNAIEQDAPLVKVYSTANPDSTTEYTYENANGDNYLLIFLNYSNASFDCDLSVEEIITNGNTDFKVNGVNVLINDRLNQYLSTITDNNYLKSKEFENTNNSLNRGQITTDAGKLAICPMENGLKYLIDLSGEINRFVVAVTNNKALGSTYTIVYNSGISTLSDRTLNYEYENSSNYNYLLVFYYYGTPTDPISLSIQELSFNGKMTVNGLEVALADQIPLTYNNYMSDLSVESVATVSDLYALYDALITAYPNYISKNILGQDSLGNNIVEYVLTSGNYNSQVGQRTEDAEIIKPKVLIVTGVHGYERSSVMSTYQFVRDLCNGNPKIADLRENYIFKVVPCVTPSSFNADTRTNSNGVNINRNFEDYWTLTPEGNNYSGASAADQLETQTVQDWIDDNTNAILYIDFHNSAFDNEVSYIQGSNAVTEMNDIKAAYLKNIYMTSAYWKEIEKFASNLIFAYTGGEDQIASSNCYAHITGGLLSILLETSWDQNGSGKHSKMTIKTGAEALGNMLIGILGIT